MGLHELVHLLGTPGGAHLPSLRKLVHLLVPLQYHNMIFVDQPIGTGFSYSEVGPAWLGEGVRAGYCQAGSCRHSGKASCLANVPAPIVSVICGSDNLQRVFAVYRVARQLCCSTSSSGFSTTRKSLPSCPHADDDKRGSHPGFDAAAARSLEVELELVGASWLKVGPFCCASEQDDRDRVHGEVGVANDMLDFVYEFLEREF